MAVAPDQSLDLSLNPSLMLQGHQPRVAHRKDHELVTVACLTSPFGCTRSRIVPGACYGRFLGSGITSDTFRLRIIGRAMLGKKGGGFIEISAAQVIGYQNGTPRERAISLFSGTT